ncbi:MAG: hypothetical protein NT007_17960 [Candidatus Kapabacteria bacterium]|nr:hypothetical protein [Candidatus Kapabacteria bacterium]
MADLRRDFAMSNYALSAFATNIISFMTRDSTEFTARGVTSLMRTAFQTLITAFGVFPSDEEYKGLVTIEVEAKTVLRSSIIIKVQSISGYVEQKWGIGSGQYKRLAIAGFHKMGDDEFLFRSREVVRIATEYLTDLTPIGLTHDMIDDLEDLTNGFQSKMQSTSDAKALRDIKTRERIEKGNELYSFIVKYCKIGKLIWENVSSSKYSDYIIYETSYPVLPKPQNLNIVFNPVGLNIELSWDAVSGATYYEVFYCLSGVGLPSGDYNLLNTYNSSPIHTAGTINKRNYFKIKAKNETQSSDYSDEVWWDIA